MTGGGGGGGDHDLEIFRRVDLFNVPIMNDYWRQLTVKGKRGLRIIPCVFLVLIRRTYLSHHSSSTRRRRRLGSWLAVNRDIVVESSVHFKRKWLSSPVVINCHLCCLYHLFASLSLRKQQYKKMRLDETSWQRVLCWSAPKKLWETQQPFKELRIDRQKCFLKKIRLWLEPTGQRQNASAFAKALAAVAVSRRFKFSTLDKNIY